MSSATITLTGPSSTPGHAQVSTAEINTQVNAALLSNYVAANEPRLAQSGIIIPYYFYPNNPYTDPVFQSVITLLRKYHTVPVIVVLDQPGFDGTGGPGPLDGNYSAAIRLLKATNCIVLGYVHTSYGARSSALVTQDILTWKNLYSPTVDGIFFDEMAYDPGTDLATQALYQGWYAYAHSLGLGPIVGNPGSDEAPAWYSGAASADIININETTTWPSVPTVAGAFAGGHGDYDYRMNSILVYNQPTFSLTTFQTMQPFVQWFYVTDQNLPNPWGALSAHLPSLFAACALPANGEYSSSTVASGAAVALTTATPANVTSLSLTAGTWDISGTVSFTPAVTTSITNLQGGVNSTSATLPGAITGGQFGHFQTATVPGAVNPAYSTGTRRLILTVTTTVYLVAQAAFTVSTCGAFGILAARRVPA
jgi:hypothetical protein